MSELGRYRGGHPGGGNSMQTPGGGHGAGVREEQSGGLFGRHGETSREIRGVEGVRWWFPGDIWKI